MRALYVRAYLRSGGVPARIVSAGEGSAPVPDLTSTFESRAMLEHLDELVEEGIADMAAERTSYADSSAQPVRGRAAPPLIRAPWALSPSKRGTLRSVSLAADWSARLNYAAGHRNRRSPEPARSANGCVTSAGSGRQGSGR
jgi:hypothetical protein